MADDGRWAGTTAEDREHKLPRVTKVKNRQPADKQVRRWRRAGVPGLHQACCGLTPANASLQITAEQILRESKALQQDAFKPPAQKITDPEELAGAQAGPTWRAAWRWVGGQVAAVACPVPAECRLASKQFEHSLANKFFLTPATFLRSEGI